MIGHGEVDMKDATLIGEVIFLTQKPRQISTWLCSFNVSIHFIFVLAINDCEYNSQGAYGEVYLVKWRGTEVAAKTIRASIASNPMVK